VGLAPGVVSQVEAAGGRLVEAAVGRQVGAAGGRRVEAAEGRLAEVAAVAALPGEAAAQEPLKAEAEVGAVGLEQRPASRASLEVGHKVCEVQAGVSEVEVPRAWWGYSHRRSVQLDQLGNNLQPASSDRPPFSFSRCFALCNAISSGFFFFTFSQIFKLFFLAVIYRGILRHGCSWPQPNPWAI